MHIDETILVVDDDERILQTISRNLSLAGYTVITASGGTEAVECYRQQYPDIVLTDVRMPYVDGFAVLAQIREHNPDAEVILITGHGDMDLAIAALRAGASDIIPKPIEQATLTNVLRHAHSRLGLRRELVAAREELRVNEARYRAITETMLAGIGIVEADGRLGFVNQAFADMVGYTQTMLTGRSLSGIMPPVAFVHYQQQIQRDDVDEQYQYETALLHKDGARLNVIISATPLRETDQPALRTLVVITDITERKRAEEGLRQAHAELEQRVDQRTAELSEANRQYEGLVNSIDGIVWEADAQMAKFSFVSKQAEQLLGYPVADWLAQPGVWNAHLHHDDREWVIDFYHNASQKNAEYELEYRMMAAKGNPVWLKDIVTVVTEECHPTMLRGMMLDITERKRLEEHLEAIYLLGQNLTLLHDENTIVHRALETAAQVIRFEYAGFSLVDAASSALIQRYHLARGVLEITNLRLPLEGTHGITVAVVREGQAINVPDTREDARYVFFDVGQTPFRSELCVPMKIGERVIGVLNVESTDVNRFTAADQQLLQALANQTAVALENARLYTQTQRSTRELAILNSATHALASNLDLNTVLKLTIIEINTLLQAEDASVLLHDPDNEDLVFAAVASGEAFTTLFGKHISAKAGIAGWTVRNKQSVLVDNAQEDERFYRDIDMMTGVTTRSLMAVPLISKDNVIGVIEVINKIGGVFDAHDVELIEALASSAAVAIDNARLYRRLLDQIQMLQDTQAQLIHSEKMAALGRLVASISHEINNPLQSIQGCLTLADEELDGDIRPEKLTRYLHVAEDEIERIAAIVRRVRDFYRPSDHEQMLTDLHKTLESVLELSGKQLQHSQVTVERLWAPHLPEITANADHLKQVFLNLVLNAIDAMPEGGTLTIRTALSYDTVAIEFSDTGIGMSEETQARLFEPFFTTKSHGSGLGLSISYGIIEAHNGQITATSALGQGTTFSIILPVSVP